MTEITLAVIKPHVLRNTYALQQIKSLIEQNFRVLDQKEVHITKDLSDRFYAEHQGKFFYHRLTSFMNSSSF
ncbi:nucleoside diphosphate kinase 6 isoform X3 [Drosophila pseudoobscura]|uniref:Nucleoside diphosphate kinase 6 isoform X3 n=1 Tax=Drosophila pseudoobscura pseudoobscura TaxID=46245 RepID=A0A0R3NZY3_DROPS|nr:nucleoside diphosphate kinase 6 isoform X3 [Drosophila pseudoobscura]